MRVLDAIRVGIKQTEAPLCAFKFISLNPTSSVSVCSLNGEAEDKQFTVTFQIEKLFLNQSTDSLLFIKKKKKKKKKVQQHQPLEKSEQERSIGESLFTQRNSRNSIHNSIIEISSPCQVYSFKGQTSFDTRVTFKQNTGSFCSYNTSFICIAYDRWIFHSGLS